MNYLASNIRFLRKQKDLTQDALALEIDVNRSMIGAYEEGRAVPRIGVLQRLSVFFGVKIDDLINRDLTRGSSNEVDIKGAGLRILTTVVDRDDREMITIVPVKAAAGYMAGYGDREYMEQLPRFSLPMPELGGERTRRVFQIRGDSMLPVQPGSYVLCEYLQDWAGLAEGATYVLLTLNDGIVYKRVYNRIAQDNTLLLKSDNQDYRPYNIAISEINEIWRAIGVISFDMGNDRLSDRPDAGSDAEKNVGKKAPGDQENPGIRELASMVMEMRKELDVLKKGRNI
jgi:transcriptional regulator with XRE-family HTH domain